MLFAMKRWLFAALQAATVVVARASEKIIWRLNFTSRSPILVTGAEEKADCSSAGFFPIYIITKPNEFNHNFCICLSFLPVSFFFYLLSLRVNKTVQQGKLFKAKTTFFEQFQCGLVLVSGTNPM